MQFSHTFYDSDDLNLMSDALNAAWLSQRSHHEPVEQPLLAAMAGQIMTAVSGGERDPERLRLVALEDCERRNGSLPPRCGMKVAAPAFDYTVPAELFSGARGFRGRDGSLRYQRFDSAAQAIRHVVEQLPQSERGGTVLEVGEARYDHAFIRMLYVSAAYPLARSPPK